MVAWTKVLGVKVVRRGRVRVESREEVGSKDVNLGVISVIDTLKASDGVP